MYCLSQGVYDIPTQCRAISCTGTNGMLMCGSFLLSIRAVVRIAEIGLLDLLESCYYFRSWSYWRCEFSHCMLQPNFA